MSPAESVYRTMMVERASRRTTGLTWSERRFSGRHEPAASSDAENGVMTGHTRRRVRRRDRPLRGEASERRERRRRGALQLVHGVRPLVVGLWRRQQAALGSRQCARHKCERKSYALVRKAEAQDLLEAGQDVGTGGGVDGVRLPRRVPPRARGETLHPLQEVLLRRAEAARRHVLERLHSNMNTPHTPHIPHTKHTLHR